MKRDVMAARNAVQFRGTAPRCDDNVKKRPNIARKQFRSILNEVYLILFFDILLGLKLKSIIQKTSNIAYYVDHNVIRSLGENFCCKCTIL